MLLSLYTPIIWDETMGIYEISYCDLKALFEKAGQIESRFHSRRGINEIFANGKLLAIEVLDVQRITSRYFSDKGNTL